MKNLRALLCMFFAVYGLNAQDLVLNNPLPVNKKITKGVLKNGMTYYIYKTDVIKNVASYYIIQNVGSVLENDDQQGLAHFLEHMAFNGTQNFEGKGVLNTLQKHGAVFGKDINAYTSFDETVYNMDNIPTNIDGLIDTSLLILYDWANGLLLTNEEIDSERGVIKEEWRTRQSGKMRVLKKTLPVYFNNSKYANRMPIGLMDVVQNFEYKALKSFYHDWYRTDLQAIAVVGDIDVDEMEQKITDMFSSIPKVKNPKERYIVEIPNNEEMLYVLAMDEEVTTANISFGMSHPKSLKSETVLDLKESLLNSIVTNMLSARLREESQKPDASFLAAQIGYGKFARAKNKFSITIIPKSNKQEESFNDVLTEINRAVKFGFTQEEITRRITQINTFYENKISKIGDMPHQSIIASIKNNYLNNATITDVKKEYELAKSLFPLFNTTTVHNTIKKLYSKKNRSLVVTGVKGINNLSEERALEIITTVENSEELLPYVDKFGGKTLLADLKLEDGKIKNEEFNKDIKSTTFILSNGIKVHYKFADKNKNDVKLKAVSDGGLSLLDKSELPSSFLLNNLIQMSGIGEYSSTDLQKVLAGKSASTSISLSNLNESISGKAVTKDVETMLQLVHLRFVKPRFDENAYKVLMSNVYNYKTKRSMDINEKMKDSVTVTLYGKNHSVKRIFNDDFINDFSFDVIKNIYLNRFKNAADFEFFIVGDVSESVLKPLLEKYIASIPTTKNKENWIDNSVNWVSDSIDKDIYLKMEDPKSSVRIYYKNDVEYSLKNVYLARALGDMLQLRYTETLREEEGGTYGARAVSGVVEKPTSQGYILVSFDCNPDKVEKLIGIVHDEIKKIANGTVKTTDLDKTITNYLKERQQQKNYNSYEMSLLTNYFLEGYNMNETSNFEDIIHSISSEDIQMLAKKILTDSKLYEIVFKPKK